MKKMNFFKILMGLILTFVVSGVFAQTQPSTDKSSQKEAVNYVEVLQDDGAGGYVAASGAGGSSYNFDSGDVNYVTVSHAGTNLVTYAPAGADETATFTVASLPVTHLIPFAVIPDQILNPGSFVVNGAGDDYTPANINSTFNWGVSAGTSTFVGVDALDADYAAWTAGALYGVNNYYTNYLQVGTSAVEANFNVEVTENSMNAGQTAVLCVDGSATVVTMGYKALPAVSAVAVNVENCISTLLTTTQTLTLDLTGTAPFFLAYYHKIEVDINGDGDYLDLNETTYENRYVVTDAVSGNTSTDFEYSGGAWNATAGANIITGTVTDGGSDSWTYTLPVTIADGSQFDIYTNAGQDYVTTHTFAVGMVNDHYSRKSDRQGTGVDADYFNHVLYAGSGTMSIVQYPTPNTGNIFTLPN